jgi:hypothetical protein
METEDAVKKYNTLPTSAAQACGRSPVWRGSLPARDSVVAILDATPWDDEPYTQEERATVETALGEPCPSVPLEAATRELLYE